MQATSSVIYGTQVIQVSVQENSHRKTPRLSIVILPHLAFSQYLQPARYLRPACERCSGSRCHSYSKRDRETRQRDTFTSHVFYIDRSKTNPSNSYILSHNYLRMFQYNQNYLLCIYRYNNVFCKVIMFQKEYLAIVILPNTFPKLLRPKLLSTFSFLDKPR